MTTVTARDGARDRAEGEIGVLDVQFGQNPGDRLSHARRPQFRRPRQRRAQQHDSEVGVLTDRGARGFDRAEDARADGHLPPRDRFGGDFGAAPEIRDARSVSIGEHMDIARLRGFEFVQARADEGARDFGVRRAQIATSRAARAPSAPTRSRAITAAIFADVTR